jgi:ribonuclease Z
VTVADGRLIDPEDVFGPPELGKKLVVVGDAETTEGLAEQVRDADVLVIEATFLERDASVARDYGHLTASEAAVLAATGEVKQLVLTHIPDATLTKKFLGKQRRSFRTVESPWISIAS